MRSLAGVEHGLDGLLFHVEQARFERWQGDDLILSGSVVALLGYLIEVVRVKDDGQFDAGNAVGREVEQVSHDAGSAPGVARYGVRVHDECGVIGIAALFDLGNVGEESVAREASRDVLADEREQVGQVVQDAHPATARLVVAVGAACDEESHKAQGLPGLW